MIGNINNNFQQFDSYIKKRAAESATVFTQNIQNVLAMNGKSIDSEELQEIYDNVYYAEIEHIKAKCG